jgi:hypothetical protein
MDIIIGTHSPGFLHFSVAEMRLGVSCVDLGFCNFAKKRDLDSNPRGAIRANRLYRSACVLEQTGITSAL